MESIWSQGCQIRAREPLSGDLECEVAVVGAGMAGVLIAHALQEAGHQVVVLEANRTGSGQTGNTTAKVTAQHGLIYEKLIRTLGKDRARQYGQAHQAAIQAYRDLIRRERIDCGWQDCSAYVYGKDREQLQGEAEAAASLGLPAVFTRDLPPWLPAEGAVRFDHQGQFHPLQFLRAVSGRVTIYENTPVQIAEGDLLYTTRGKVRAEHIVFACHYPFVNVPGLYFARMHQTRSYVLALEHVPRLDGMFIGAGPDSISLRNHGDLLLLGGGGHRTGENPEGGRYDFLRQVAGAWFPGSREVAHWSAQDCMTPDGAAYIGPFAPSRPHWYVATGFQKWGMTASMVSALVLRDLIGGKESPYGDVFDPGRLEAGLLPGLAKEGGPAVKGIMKQVFQRPKLQADQLPAGHGGIVKLDGKKAGAYRDENGDLYPVATRCPHLGCQLAWNPDEKSWDCPCHGSRFDCRGELLSGPAQRGICHGKG